MKHEGWKIATVALTFLIMLTLGINQSFVSYSNNFTTTGHGSNGTVIVVAIEKGLMVHGGITVSYEGAAVGHPRVILPNGSAYTVYSSLQVNFSFGPVLFAGQTSEYGGPANLSISPSSPVDAGMISNVTNSFLHTVIDAYRENGINCYAIFIQNFSAARVIVVGGL